MFVQNKNYYLTFLIALRGLVYHIELKLLRIFLKYLKENVMGVSWFEEIKAKDGSEREKE